MDAIDATDEQIRDVFGLICELADMKGVSRERVTRAVLSSKALRHYGYRQTQKGHLTAWQADAAKKLLQGWIDGERAERRAKAAEADARAREAGHA